MSPDSSQSHPLQAILLVLAAYSPIYLRIPSFISKFKKKFQQIFEAKERISSHKTGRLQYFPTDFLP